MRRALILAIVAGVAQSACAPATLLYPEAHRLATARVTGYLDALDPTADHRLRAECTVKAMSHDEIVKLGNDDPVQAGTPDDALMAAASRRPAVATCVAEAAAKAGAAAGTGAKAP